ncbi:ATP-binding cassette domain-containing protein [Anaerolineales bacterium HSG25]|nr:ATP-binding cassette domain-containing protein [Anaerolineales bacterium HSG25]
MSNPLPTPPAEYDKQLIVSWPGEQLDIPLDKSCLHLGRSKKGNDIIIEYPVISRHHATLKLENDQYHIIDGQTRDGTSQRSTNGLFFEGKRVQNHLLQNGDIIRIPDQKGNFIILMYFDSSAPPPAETERIQLDKEITIGRDHRNDLVLNDLQASKFHAAVSVRNHPIRKGESVGQSKRHAIRDLRSNNGTYINGNRIVNQADLRVGDMVQIGSNQLRYKGDSLIRVDLRQRGIQLDGVHISKRVRDTAQTASTQNLFDRLFNPTTAHKILLNDISLSIHPREFVAIVGESGSGKSTLLDALNGSRPADGTVLINGNDLYQQFDAYRQGIGYVPQDDIVHQVLTVHEVLAYVARLRLPPDTPTSEIEHQINKVLEQVGLLDKKQVLVKHLSGGQRKRVSIAVELIADPGIIFLDEPTSGLDPGLDHKMMFTLKQLAHASGKTVILVTHATSNITEADMVLFLARGGHVAFYGSPQEALKFFEVEDFAQIYQKVELEAKQWIERYRQSDYYQRYVEKRLNPTCPYCQAPLTDKQRKKCPSCGKSLVAEEQNRHRGGTFRTANVVAQQTIVLTQRYLHILWRDRSNLLFLLLQAPIIAMLLFFVMDMDVGMEEADKGIFYRSHMFTACKESIEERQNDYINKEQKVPTNIPCKVTVENVTEIEKIIFILACIATWFGIINAIREIVKELPIYRRERLVNLRIAAYLGSKLIVMLGLSVIQAFSLIFVISLYAKFPLIGVLAPTVMELFISLTLVTFTSACWGLFLSAIMGREDRVMSIIPFFLVPQIVFAGIIFPVEAFEFSLRDISMDPAAVISVLTFSRWGVEALGSSVDVELASAGLKATLGTAEDLPFDFTHSFDYLMHKWLILASYTIIAIILTYVGLRRQDVKRR